MRLYEVSNGYTGESYVRVYVWTISETKARETAKKAFKKDAGNYGESYYNELEVELLMSSDDDEFSTIVSDFGWKTEDGSDV